MLIDKQCSARLMWPSISGLHRPGQEGGDLSCWFYECSNLEICVVFSITFQKGKLGPGECHTSNHLAPVGPFVLAGGSDMHETQNLLRKAHRVILLPS